MNLFARIRARNQDDGVVTVILAAGVLIVLLGIGAFAVDVSQAYAVRRQLSSAADSASLAAAWDVVQTYGTYDGTPQTCADMQSLGGSLAQSTEQSYTVKNEPLDTMGESDTSVTSAITCPDDYSMDVSATNVSKVRSVFGSVLGVASLNPTQSATAQVQVADTLTGLRPYAICINDVNTLKGDSNPLTETWHVVQYAFVNSTSPCKPSQGDWFVLQCPGEGGSNSALAYDTANGCKNKVTADYVGPDTPSNESTLYNYCNQVTPPSVTCLLANTGANMTSNKVDAAWNNLLGKIIFLPVIYPRTMSCPPLSLGNLFGTTLCGGAGNPVYPVAGFIGVQVCGWHWQNQYGGAANGDYPYSDGSACTRPGYEWGATTETAPANDSPNLSVKPASDDNYLLLAYSSYIAASFSFDGNGGGTCAFSDSSCNNGVFSVQLIK